MSQVVIGCIDNYRWEHVKYWINSLRRVYNGDVVLLYWPKTDKDCIEKLSKPPYNVIMVPVEYENNLNIVVHRFLAMHMYLSSKNYNQIVTTDVKDVVFQSENFFVPQYVTYNIEVTKEHFTYEEEPWSKQNMMESFGGQALRTMLDFPVVCAGVISGNENLIKLFLNIYLISRSSMSGSYSSGGGGPDQSALNLLLSVDNNLIHKNDSFDGKIVHLGTSMKAVTSGAGEVGHRYRTGNLGKVLEEKIELLHLTEQKNLSLNTNRQVCWNSVPYNIVHQWDRIPVWKEEIERLYEEL